MKQKLLKILYRFLAFCARVYLIRTKPIVIGVTGSVGKTSCRMILAQVLEQIQTSFNSPLTGEIKPQKNNFLKIYTSPKNFNSELGMIFSIFCIEEYDPSIKNLLKLSGRICKESFIGNKKYDILIAEYGIDTPGDMNFLLHVMKADIAILTKLDYVHSGNFPRGVLELWEEKWKLLLSAKKKVYFNAGDEFSKRQEYLLSKPYNKIFEKDNTIQLKKSKTGLSQQFLYQKKSISINLVGEENIQYTLLGLKIAQDLGMKLPEKEYDFEYIVQAGRFSFFERGNNIFIDSSYNAGPESMKKIIESIKCVHKELFPDYNIAYVLGDMREIGELTQSAHRDLFMRIKQADFVFTAGPEMYKHLIPELKNGGFKGDIFSALSSREVGLHLRKYLREHTDTKYLILFKGSQNTIFMEESLAAQLTPTQQKNLPRQSKDWKTKKDEFFEGL